MQTEYNREKSAELAKGLANGLAADLARGLAEGLAEGLAKGPGFFGRSAPNDGTDFGRCSVSRAGPDAAVCSTAPAS